MCQKLDARFGVMGKSFGAIAAALAASFMRCYLKGDADACDHVACSDYQTGNWMVIARFAIIPTGMLQAKILIDGGGSGGSR